MKTNMYNVNINIHGIPAFENMIKSRLNYIAEKMPLNKKNEGQFLNSHNDGIDYCPGIVMLGDGKICAIYPRCSLNPLAWNGKEVVLSTWATGGIFGKSNEDWGKSIQHYNESLSEYSGSVAIIGYIIFAEDKIDNEKTENQWVDHIGLPKEEPWVDHIDLPGDPVKKSDETAEIVERRRVF